MTDVEVTVQLFGAFRELGESDTISLTVPAGTTVKELRLEIAAALESARPGFRYSSLVPRSALGDEREILSEETRIERPSRLALLPPVCGGAI